MGLLDFRQRRIKKELKRRFDETRAGYEEGHPFSCCDQGSVSDAVLSDIVYVLKEEMPDVAKMIEKMVDWIEQSDDDIEEEDSD